MLLPLLPVSLGIVLKLTLRSFRAVLKLSLYSLHEVLLETCLEGYGFVQVD